MKPKFNIRQQKIDTIIRMITGEVKSVDLPPRMVFKIDADGNRTFTINNKIVDEELFNEELAKCPNFSSTDFFKTIGREDDDAEYYYGNVPFSIYKDGRPLLNY